MSGARDAIARLRRHRSFEPQPRELLLSRRHARLLADQRGEPVEGPPRDYADEPPADEQMPFEARPMFGLCEWTLILSLAGLGLLFIAFRFWS